MGLLGFLRWLVGWGGSSGSGFWGGVFLGEAVEELAHDAAGALGLGELGCGGEEALFGVGGDLFDGLWALLRG